MHTKRFNTFFKRSSAIPCGCNFTSTLFLCGVGSFKYCNQQLMKLQESEPFQLHIKGQIKWRLNHKRGYLPNFLFFITERLLLLN